MHISCRLEKYLDGISAVSLANEISNSCYSSFSEGTWIQRIVSRAKGADDHVKWLNDELVPALKKISSLLRSHNKNRNDLDFILGFDFSRLRLHGSTLLAAWSDQERGHLAKEIILEQIMPRIDRALEILRDAHDVADLSDADPGPAIPAPPRLTPADCRIMMIDLAYWTINECFMIMPLADLFKDPEFQAFRGVVERTLGVGLTHDEALRVNSPEEVLALLHKKAVSRLSRN